MKAKITPPVDAFHELIPGDISEIETRSCIEIAKKLFDEGVRTKVRFKPSADPSRRSHPFKNDACAIEFLEQLNKELRILIKEKPLVAA